jgi:hypothetical protein
MNSNLENKIKNLIKQNDSIYSSLLSKNISFERIIINDEITDEEKIFFLMEENEKLKYISKSNRPPPEVKIVKPIITETKKIEKKVCEDTCNDTYNDEDENYEIPEKKFTTITNMEEIKRAFFNKDYELFEELIKKFNFKYYRADYKYSNDKDGAPEFIAKNLVKGFVRNLDDYRKYFMVCFRCYKNENNYSYPSLWIVNSNDDIKNIIESIHDDYIYTEESNIPVFLKDIQKIEDENCIEESYVH